MLKKMLALLLILAMALGCTVAQAAAPGEATLFGPDEDGTPSNAYPRMFAAVGDTLYMLMNETELEADYGVFNLYSYTVNKSDAPELVAKNVPYTQWYNTVQDMQDSGLDPNQGVSMLVGDADTLYVFNQLTGAVSKASFEGGSMKLDTIVTINPTSLYQHENSDDGEEWAYPADLRSPFVQDGHLYFISNSWVNDSVEYRLYDIDLSSGEQKSVVIQVASYVDNVVGYRDGMALCHVGASYDAESTPPSISTLNLTDGTLTVVVPLEDTLNISGMASDPANDTLYYYSNNTVWAMQGLGDAKKVAYGKMSYAEDRMLYLPGGYMALCGGSDGIEILNIDPQYMPTKTLTIVGGWRDKGARLFNAQNPDVALLFANRGYGSSTELGQAMISGDTSIDVINYSYSNNFDVLMKKGFCADLSGSEKLMNFVKSMYPAMQNAVMRDGKLYAIPTSMWGEGWSYSKETLESVGLTEDDLPTNLIDLCAFITRWNDEWYDDEDKANMMPLCTIDIRGTIFNMMLNGYIDYYAATNQDLDFNTPLFNELLTALDEMHTDNFIVSPDMTEEEYQAFYDNYTGLFNAGYGLLSEVDPYATPCTFSLSKDVDYYVSAEMGVMFVNPRCQNLDEAIKLLECYADGLDERYQIIFSPEHTDGIPNDYYDTLVSDWEKQLEDTKANLATADESDKRIYQDDIAYLEELLAHKEQYAWELSPASVQQYHDKIGAHLIPRGENPIYASNDDSLSSLNERYLQKQLPRDQYIKELSQKIRMIVLENQ